MCLGKGGTHHDTTLCQCGGFAEGGAPRGCQVKCGCQLVVGRSGNRHHRLRQDGDVHFPGGKHGAQFGRLCIGVVDCDVLARLQSVLPAQGSEDKGGILRGAVDRFALQILKRGHADALAGDHIQHTQRIDCQHLHRARLLGIQIRGGVCGQSGNVYRAVEQSGQDIGGVAFYTEGVFQRRCPLGGLLHQLGHAEAGGAGQNGDIDIQIFVNCLSGRGIRVARGFRYGFGACACRGFGRASAAAGCKREREAKCQQERQHSCQGTGEFYGFHGMIPFLSECGWGIFTIIRRRGASAPGRAGKCACRSGQCARRFPARPVPGTGRHAKRRARRADG